MKYTLVLTCLIGLLLTNASAQAPSKKHHDTKPQYDITVTDAHSHIIGYLQYDLLNHRTIVLNSYLDVLAYVSGGMIQKPNSNRLIAHVVAGWDANGNSNSDLFYGIGQGYDDCIWSIHEGDHRLYVLAGQGGIIGYLVGNAIEDADYDIIGYANGQNPIGKGDLSV